MGLNQSRKGWGMVVVVHWLTSFGFARKARFACCCVRLRVHGAVFICVMSPLFCEQSNVTRWPRSRE
jgi:hypothetical protein